MLNDQRLADKYALMNAYTSPVKRAEREIIGREKEMTRLMAAMCRPELCNAILLAEAGSGKALANDTLIPVQIAQGGVPGFRSIKDIRSGDVIYDEQGRPANVLRVFPQGRKPAYKISFEDGDEIICNDEHIWAVRSESGVDACVPWQEKTLREMLDAGSDKSWYVPVTKAVQYPERVLPVPAYAMGVLLVSGRFDSDGVRILSDDEWMVRRVGFMLGAKAVSDGDGVHVLVLPDGTWLKPSWFLRRGIPESCMEASVQSRTTPREYLSGSVAQRMDFLQGIMDAGGMVMLDTDVGMSVRLRCHGADISKHVRMLASSLGIRSVIFHFDSTGERDDIIFIPRGATELAVLDFFRDLFWSPSRQVRVAKCLEACHGRTFRSVRAYDSMKIVGVEELNTPMDMTCIYVDSPSHLFLCGENYIPTHNTALVQGTMLRDAGRDYLEVDLAKMITACTTDANQMAALLKGLFDEVADYCKSVGKEVVLFIDEFHQVVQLSDAAVEALKPLLADSGTRGIRVIAATTYIEFRKYISPNQPLVERLQRINLPEPDKATVIEILKGMTARYGVSEEISDDGLYSLIYDYTNRYIPANAQPRKSLLIMDAMIGWHRSQGLSMDAALLGDVIYESEGIQVNFKADAVKIREALDKRVLSQKFATKMIEQRLQICIADLNNKKRPMSSFLFSGSTGVGKGIRDDIPIPVYTEDGSVSWKLNGELEIGDYVFNRLGKPVKVVGVFHRGLQDIYKVTFSDGREIYTDGSHLWTYLFAKGKYSANTYTNSTKELLERGVYNEGPDGRRKLKYWIPMNQAVEYPEAALSVHPYVMGAFIGDGCLTLKQLTLSSGDEDLAAHVAELLGNCTAVRTNRRNYNWVFPLIDRNQDSYARECRQIKSKQSTIVFSEYPEVCGKRAYEKRIPAAYMHGSIEQRWELVRGLFDTDGSIGGHDGGRYNVSFSSTSLGLIQDLQTVLYSLGVSSTYNVARDIDSGHGNYVQYRLNVKSSNANKDRFFWLPRKVAIADKARVDGSAGTRASRKDYDWLGISDISLMAEQAPTTCIYVDDDEHLYQAGDFIVTHNTEVSKSLAGLLFGSEDAMHRYDMSEFANPDSLERFRKELTNSVWTRPFSVILLDEVEKACAPVTRLLLQVLDDGRLTDENNRVVTFSNAYIILTTNAGSEVYKNISQYNIDDEGSGRNIMQYYKVIRDSITSTTESKFPPELLGRIDVIVPFQPLSEETMKRIAMMNLKKMMTNVFRRHGVRVGMHPDVIRYLVEDNLDTDSDSGGARVVISKLESEVTIPIAKYINEHRGVEYLNVEVVGDLVRDNENLRVSDAYIRVYEPSPEEIEQQYRHRKRKG